MLPRPPPLHYGPFISLTLCLSGAECRGLVLVWAQGHGRSQESERRQCMHITDSPSGSWRPLEAPLCAEPAPIRISPYRSGASCSPMECKHERSG